MPGGDVPAGGISSMVPPSFSPTHAPTGVFQPSRSTPWGISLIQPSLNYEGPPILSPAS